LFRIPTSAAIASSVPPRRRNVAWVMQITVQNFGSVLSVAISFALLIVGLSSTLSATVGSGLTAHGVPAAAAYQVAQTPPAASLFTAFLGENPVYGLLAPTGALAGLPAHAAATLNGSRYYAQLISGPFHQGLIIVFIVAIGLFAAAAGADFLAEARLSTGTSTEPQPETATRSA
jgi:hypothetical protein